MKRYVFAALISALVGTTPIAFAQSASDQLAEYRRMLADGNPAELYEAEGEELWSKSAGPKNASLEKCDLGLGPGVVAGASAQLPRYFKDTDRVQDLESRLMTCMETLQGIPQADIVKGSFGKGVRKNLEAIVAYVVTQSKGMKVNVPATHPKEKEMLALGEKIFYLQGGPMDFACASCHAVDGQRIRMQDLPNLTTAKGAAEGWGSWPAYRVSSGTFWTMQQRLNDCYRQQRMPFPIYGSDATIALSVFMANTANGGTIQTPGLKR
ncbi:sulfur oxidation c-type cytochrome SoxA [Zwartia sp.]|uniref:sulfur oxidation c-type cytochrome SoxA n=1 Tax=Zwartia sp. TaxID=2978004 RepID=UPI00272758D5|nr:sulfur oxidation c-type cytochrome SoxA [Zwartia sp.]MDO9024919.1 sulfur oxidation c-type cytochrome SoxA [Zwartia sp.]